MDLLARVFHVAVRLIDDLLHAVDPFPSPEEHAGDWSLDGVVSESDSGEDEFPVGALLHVPIATERTCRRIEREPVGTSGESGPSPVTAPLRTFRSRADPCLDRIEGEVAGEDDLVRFLLDQNVLESLLKEVAAATVAPVEGLHVTSKQPVHACRERAFQRGDGEVVMVGHQAVVVEDPPRARDLVGQEKKEPLAIVVVAENEDAVIAPRHDVMHRAFELDSSLPCHATEATSGN